MQGPYLPGFEATESQQESYGLRRLDHAVGNVHRMAEAVNYLRAATGFHPFAEFTTEDVGTVDSGEAARKTNVVWQKDQYCLAERTMLLRKNTVV